MMRGFLSVWGCGLLSLLLVWLAAVRPACAADPPSGEGEPFMQYFSPRDYHADTQCPCAEQDSRGVMYIGNLGSVLEYDGSTWKKIDMGQFHAVVGMAYEQSTDTIFVGAREDLGYLHRTPAGTRVFISLLDRLPPDARDVGIVFGVFVTPEAVYFVTTTQVLRWRDGQFKVWPFVTKKRLRSSWAAGNLYIFNQEIGLLRLENETFVPASTDPLLSQVVIRSVHVDADGTLVLPTFRNGLFALRDGALRPLDFAYNDFLKEKGILRFLPLRDGSMAVATEKAGLLVLDRSYRFRCHADETGGLHGGNLLNLFEDAEGGLWIGLQSGVTRAEVTSSLSILRAGPDDDFSDVTSDDYARDRMFLSSASGFYRVASADPATATSAHLERVPGTKGGYDTFCVVANGVLAALNGQITLLGPDAREVLVPTTVPNPVAVLPSKTQPGRVFVGGGGQIGSLRLDGATGRWIDEGIVASISQTTQFRMVESTLGDLWIGTKDHGLFRVQFALSGPATVTSYLDRPGPLQGKNYIVSLDYGGPILFNAQSAIYQLDASGQNVEPATQFGARFTDGSLSVYNLLCADPQNLWVIASDEKHPSDEPICGRVIAAANGRVPTFQPLPRKVADTLGEVRDFFKMGAGSGPSDPLLIAGAGGHAVVRLDVRKWDAQLASARPFATLIRQATVIARPAAGSVPEPVSGEPLRYERNSVHFEFAAATMALGAAPRFQTRLVNFGAGDWSDFSDRNSVDYLNLPEGRYVFEARARTADGQLGTVGSLPFRVLPPWQRTGWAYAAYALALLAGTAGLVLWRGWRLRRRNAALETLVDARTGELRQREAELVRARDDAESANRAKSAFLANMSHELRTPLNAVLGYTQLLLKQPDLAPRSRERITVIGQSGGHLLSLVNEVLDLSKVEAGKLTLSQFDFSLPGLLGEVGAAFRPRLIEKGLTFTEERAPGLPVTVHTDPSRLRQVLFNLLSNAVKFTHRGSVTLTVRLAGESRVRFEVTDTGVGIAPEDQRNIFLAFHQAGESSLASQGTGLGLTISQRLVELLGGRIELESVPGEGSRFWFELPLTAVEPPEGLSSHIAPQDPVLGKVTGYEGATRRLLLVDDLTENRRVLLDFLQPLGFEIEEAANGKDCLAACARQMPDALLLDLRLGTPDGFEVARTLRAGEGATRPGIIAISASVFESDRQQAIDAGCDDFLPKPFEEAQLLGALGRVLGLRWLREAPPVPEIPVTGAPAGEGTLPASEIDLLRELSLSGDVAGIRRRLDAWRTAGTPGREDEIVRRLESLAAAYDMEGIHDFLLTIYPHDGN